MFISGCATHCLDKPTALEEGSECRKSDAESGITDHRLVVMWLWQFLRMTNQVWGRPNYTMSGLDLSTILAGF